MMEEAVLDRRRNARYICLIPELLEPLSLGDPLILPVHPIPSVADCEVLCRDDVNVETLSTWRYSMDPDWWRIQRANTC